MNIGNKIKKLRVDSQMTQEQLAEKLHVTRNAISKWETDKGIPNIDSLVDLTKLFNISLDSLFSNEEITIITLENKENIEYTKNLVYSMMLVIIYASIGILIPHYSFKYDPTSGIAVFAILLPISYIILGVISVLIKVRWPYVVISSALALTPIYIYFDSLATIKLGFWGIVYLILYYASYFILSGVIKSSMIKSNPLRLKKFFLITSSVISLVYILHTTIEAISLYNCFVCSAPWYTVVVINTLFYIVPLVISYTLLIYFSFKYKRINQTPSVEIF
jgi:transcriptional regulator with XRE-family HTH domain